MLALKVLEVKVFMGKLFQKNDFDGFLLSEAEVQTAAGYKINGHRSRSFYTEEEFAKLPEPDFLRWEELKPLVFQMIRGSRTPQQLSVVFCHGVKRPFRGGCLPASGGEAGGASGEFRREGEAGGD